MDEDTALSDMHKKADKLYEDNKKKEAEAMRYWDEIKKQEQEKYSDEEDEEERVSKTSNYTDSNSGYSRRRLGGSRDKLEEKESDVGVSNGLEATRVWQEKFEDVEEKYKEAMVSNAQLYNEKTTLVFQVESLKDRLEDVEHDMVELRADLQREQSRGNQLVHKGEGLESEKSMLLKQIEFRDQFIEKHGLVLPTGEEEEEQTAITQEMISSEEREKLLKEISELKEELSSIKSSSAVLGDQQPRDIVQVSTRMVSEYKSKLQIAESENTRLDGTVTRLKGQVDRYKNQIKELEAREDELMKEKRKLTKEIRSNQAEIEDSKIEIDLLKRKNEQLRKRRDYGQDT